MKINSPKVKIREAQKKDIPQILTVEKDAWGEKNAASEEMFNSRIETFPEGVLVAELTNGEIVGVVVAERVNYDIEKNAYSWYEITDNGFIKNSHKPGGNTIYGVDLSVKPSFQRLGIGAKLLKAIGKLVINYNLRYGILGGRIPAYYKYAHQMGAEEYIKATVSIKGKIRSLDPEIDFYRKAGLKIIKIIPNYFEDHESLNYGVLLLWENPLYNKWYRWLASKFL